MSEFKKIFVDIDETICTKSPHGNYALAKKIPENIEKINKLYRQGHHIVYWTARGSVTKIDWSDVTKKQFEEWNVLYHELRFGKPAFDILIDDKVLNSKFNWNRDNFDKIIQNK